MEALLLVDIQNDFLPGGALAVPEGDEVIPVANALMDRFGFVVATADWHPQGHVSFADSHPGHEPGETITVDGIDQYLWPPHCIQGTRGAEFPEALNTDGIDRVVRKGRRKDLDSYSGFFDNARRGATDLEDLLRAKGAYRVHVCGLATDVCVRATALDARDLGFETILVVDGCRGVDANPGDVQKAIDEMTKAGVQRVESEDILKEG